MTSSADQFGDLLRQFYGTYGMPDEGPPADVNVSALVGSSVIADSEITQIRGTLDDVSLRRQFGVCREILEDLAKRLTSEELLRELSTVAVSPTEFERLTSGVFWYGLAASLDQRQRGLPVTPFDEQLQVPLPAKVMMVVQGSLVMRLYLALVHMREGVLADLIRRGAQAQHPCCGRVRRFLDCDYVRRIRNALSHGSFSPCSAGISFHDDGGDIIATPGFLNWMCLWLTLIQLQALSAGAPHAEAS